MTIYGLGGCGKSALALEFAYRTLARQTKRLVFWVPAISQESFEAAYREIGTQLRMPGINDDNADIKKLVKAALSSGIFGNWLIIVDNADDPRIMFNNSTRLIDYLPHSEQGAILFTTRSRKSAVDLTQSNILELNDMAKAESGQLFTRRITNSSLLNDKAAVDELLEILTYLPLALVQAAAYINSNDISVSEYTSLFRSTGTQQNDAENELFSENFEDPSRYREMDGTIAKTWHISFDQISRQDQLAAEYLSFMACINRINIPQSLLPSAGSSMMKQVKALGILTGYAFITERQKALQDSGERLFDMHRLVHMASGWWLDRHDERVTWTNIALVRLKELIPFGEHSSKEVWTAYLPHAIYTTGLDGNETVKASLLEQVGCCQASLGQFSAAERTHRREASSRENLLGPDHSSTLMSMNSVAMALRSQGKYEAAEVMSRNTLTRSEKALGPEHIDTLITMSNLTLSLNDQGKYEEAELINRQTLVQLHIVLGPMHPVTLRVMSILTRVLSNQGKYDEAEVLIRQTLRRTKKVLGPEHLDTQVNMNNLAIVLNKRHKYEEAELIHRQALVWLDRVLGPEHPNTLSSIGNLALVLNNQKKFEEAESLMRQTLIQREKVLGPEHPLTLTSMNNLARVLDDQGKHEEAESIHRQQLAICEQEYGPDNLDTTTSVYCLAHTLANQRKYHEALDLYKRACDAYDTILGADHPTTCECHDYHYTVEQLAREYYAENEEHSMKEQEHSMKEQEHSIKEQEQFAPSPEILESSANRHVGKASRLSRTLAKMGIKGSKSSKKVRASSVER
jgi:tetratricopeptide (TPR) repeat protein